MDMISFKEEVLRLIAFWQEGEYWDFKKEWHKNKSDLLVAKLWGVGMKRAKTLITAAEHSVGMKCYNYGGIHCGEVFEFRMNEVWIPARVEMGDDRKWYLVGLPGIDHSFYVPLILNEVGGIFMLH